jgi:hypothetical protein
VKLPDRVSFEDKGGHIRHHTRITWWDLEKLTTEESIRDKITPEMLKQVYTKDYLKLTFFGHYWLKLYH